tara:strand:- start:207 stop:497 length:291 start_codon:yes stop_codon:yes gene_type:complete
MKPSFEFITSELERRSLIEAYDAVNTLNLWDFMRKEHKSFMFPETDFEIHEKLYDLADKTVGHSGTSYGWTMRVIEYIAKNGYENYKQKKLLGYYM